MPLVFFHLSRLGGFDLSVPYVMSLLLGMILLAQFARSAAAALHLLRAAAPWLILYLCYLLLLAFHLAGYPDKGLIVRQFFFLTCGLTIGAALLSRGGDARVLRRGGVCALVGFLLVTEAIAWTLDLSWIIALERFVLHGDLPFLVYNFFRAIFQAASADAENAVPAAVKNIVSSGLFVALVLIRAGHMDAGSDRRGKVMTLLILVLLVMLNTRAVLLVALLALPLAGVLSMARQPRHTAEGLILRGLAVVSGLIVLSLVAISEGAAIGAVGNRFSFEDASVMGRLNQVEFALAGIERSVLVGSGLSEINGQLVHNLFLGAWLHGGLLCFLLIAATYLTMIWLWARFVLGLLLGNTLWVLPARPEWVAVLPLLAFFRVWVSGDAGHPGFAEWISICGFFSLVAANAHARRGFTPEVRYGRSIGVPG